MIISIKYLDYGNSHGALEGSFHNISPGQVVEKKLGYSVGNYNSSYKSIYKPSLNCGVCGEVTTLVI